MTALDGDVEPTPLKKTTPMSRRNYKWIVPLFLGVFAAAAFYYLTEAKAVEAGLVAGEVTVKSTSGDGNGDSGSGIVSTSPGSKKKPGLFFKIFGTPSPTPPPSPAPSPSPTVAPTTEYQNPLLNFPKMLLAFKEKRQEWFDQLEKDYGKVAFNDFLRHGRTTIRPPNEDSIVRPANETVPLYSLNRMRRKLMIKLLEAQEAALHQRSRNLRPNVQSNSYSTHTRAESAQRTRRQTDFANTHEFPKFIWATGGHSATAGHGNIWRESYTKVLEVGVQDMFAACGIDFVSRNHAMGGTSSGPEIAICSKEIFGTDIDVLLWDTGMTDGREYWRLLMYFLRAGTLAQQPAVVGFNLDQGQKGGRPKMVQSAEDTGMPAFLLDKDKLWAVTIPDTFGLSDAEIAEMPKFVQNFRCAGQTEKGDPNCGKMKWNLTICADRPFKTSWHPGWKVHAYEGNILAMWLTNMMEDALKELAAKRPDPALLDQLRALEKADRKVFMSRELPMAELGGLQLPTDVDPEMFFRGPNICHTARLPAETRHLGILTESSLVGEDSYDKGTEWAARNSIPDDKSMQLVYEQAARSGCPVPLNKDYKDFFFVSDTHGWSQLTLPNNAEIKAYGTSEPLRGVIAVCFAGCNWGKCPAENLQENEIRAGMAEMEVNGVKVTNLTQFNSCSFLKHIGGHVWKPKSDGRFQIRAKVNTENKYLRFSSIVIW